MEISEAYIKKRLKILTGNSRRITNWMKRRASHEFGVEIHHYQQNISFQGFVDVTFNHRTSPSPLEIEMRNETEYYLTLL